MSFGHRQITFAFFGTIDLSINCYAFLDLVSSKDENIGNHGYIGTSILRIYRIYRQIF